MYQKFTLIVILLLLSFNTKAQIIERDPNNYSALFQEQKKHIFKINPLFILLKNFSCSFEHAIQPRRSLEYQIGFVGLGLKDHRFRTVYQGTLDETEIKTISEGFFFSVGYKIYRTPRHYRHKPHILRGDYLKPELAVGFYNIYNFSSFTPPMGAAFTIPSSKNSINYKALMLNFGSQMIFADLISLDVFWGIGLGVDNVPSVQNRFLYFGEEHPGLHKTNTGASMAFKAGINIGILLK